MPKQRQGAIVLAGGQSRRMGQDKALLTLGNMTLLEHVINRLSPVATDVVVVANRPDAYSLARGRVVGDLYPDAGPVGGILTGLNTLGDGAHLVVACDMPMLQPAVLQLLLKTVGTDMDAVVPEVNGQLEPLCAVYRHTAMPKLMQFLEKGGHSAREALNSLLLKRVGEGVLRRADPTLLSFTNLNSPQDVKQLLMALK